MDSVEVIYLSGDGVAWIKQGLDWIPKSKFILDNYHLNKYINTKWRIKYYYKLCTSISYKVLL